MLDLSGHLLVAAADMEDPHFARTVVLLIRHSSEEGAMGLVLNKPLGVPLQEILADVSADVETPEEIGIGWGGPVQGPLVVLHTLEDLADLTILPGICISTQRDRILELLRIDRRPYGFFLGYSGWGKQQLEGECQVGGWHIVEATPGLVFSDPYEMWPKACGQVSWGVLRQDPRIARLGDNDPSFN
jgi:putative transcriptional regulator